MSVWRRKAIECLSELKKEFEDPNESIYLVFSALRAAAVDFHKANDFGRLQKIYDFAEWCFRQKDKDLWNSAGVSFYEHLGDSPETLNEIRRWVKPDIYAEIRGLLELRLSSLALRQLDKAYGVAARR